METEIKTKDTEVKDGDTDLIEIEVTKPSSDNENLKIYLKSTKNFGMFTRKDKKAFTLGGIKCYFTNQDRYDGVASRFYTNQAEWMYGNEPNLSLLMAEGLNKGIIFNFPAAPINESMIDNWAASFGSSVKQLFLGYMKPYKVRMTITTCVVDTQQCD